MITPVIIRNTCFFLRCHWCCFGYRDSSSSRSKGRVLIVIVAASFLTLFLLFVADEFKGSAFMHYLFSIMDLFIIIIYVFFQHLLLRLTLLSNNSMWYVLSTWWKFKPRVLTTHIHLCQSLGGCLRVTVKDGQVCLLRGLIVPTNLEAAVVVVFVYDG